MPQLGFAEHQLEVAQSGANQAPDWQHLGVAEAQNNAVFRYPYFHEYT
jgi:hypothetical protein